MGGKQHKRQGAEGDNPSVERNHDAGLFGAHGKIFADIGQQGDGDKFGGVKNKARHGQNEDAPHGDSVNGLEVHRSNGKSASAVIKLLC